MKAIVTRITFYEAFFKVHYTKKFRLTYPIPLPTSVAGIFGAMLGIDRGKIEEKFSEFYFGARLLKHEGMIIENETFLQYKKHKTDHGIADAVKGTVRTHIINHPTYIIAMAGKEEIFEYYNFIKDHNFVYLPYGGQNDFFVEDIEIKGLTNVVQSDVVSNYAPQDMVKEFKSKEIVISILPVVHTYSSNPNFCFVLKGQLKLKESVKVVENTNIALYPLEWFNIVKG